MREHEQHLGLADRGEAHRRTHVVEKDEERSAGWQHAAVQRHANHRRTHRVLAHAVVHLPTLRCGWGVRDLAGELGARVAGQVGRASDKSWYAVECCIERLLDSNTRCDLLALLESGQCRFPTIDTAGCPARVPHGTIELAGVEAVLPLVTRRRTTRRAVHAIRVDKLGWRPKRFVGDTHDSLGARDLFGGERVAVRFVMVGEIGARCRNVAAQDQ